MFCHIGHDKSAKGKEAGTENFKVLRFADRERHGPDKQTGTPLEQMVTDMQTCTVPQPAQMCGKG